MPEVITCNLTELDVPPPGAGFTAVTSRSPTLAISDASTATVAIVPFELTVCETPLIRIEVLDDKPVPDNVKVKRGDPATTDEGLVDVRVGNGFTTVNAKGDDNEPPLRTEIGNVPALEVNCGPRVKLSD